MYDITIKPLIVLQLKKGLHSLDSVPLFVSNKDPLRDFFP